MLVHVKNSFYPKTAWLKNYKTKDRTLDLNSPFCVCCAWLVKYTLEEEAA